MCSTAEVNQLKYVCRQLNTETKSLTLKVNEVIFGAGMAEIVLFFRECPSAMLEHSSVVTIMSSELCLDSESPSDRVRKGFDTLRNFCQRYTEVLVCLRHEYLHPERCTILINAFNFQVHHRNDSSLIDQIWKEADEQAMVIADIKTSFSREQIKVLPANLRMYPPFTTFDAQGFIERMRMFESGADVDDSKEDERFTDNREKWLEQAAVIKKIFEHGV